MRLSIKDLAFAFQEGTLAPMSRGRGALIAVVALAGLLAGSAMAGTVYRCEGSDGVRSYSSKRMSGATCKAVSTFSESRSKPVATAPAKADSADATAKVAVPAAGGGTSAVAVPVSGSTSFATQPGSGKARFVRMGSATTYSYVDAHGVRNFSNRRPKGVANVTVSRTSYPIFEMETCYACALQPKVDFGHTRLNTTAYQAEIATAARDFGVEEAIVRAIIHAESAFRPNALSRVGAQGLMQLMPATAQRFGVSNAFDAGQNIRGGVQYLSWLLKRFKGDLVLASAGYNAGEGAVDKYKGVPPYSETRRYVERVRTLAERYRSSTDVR